MTYIYRATCWHGTGPEIGRDRPVPLTMTITLASPIYSNVLHLKCPICADRITARMGPVDK